MFKGVKYTNKNKIWLNGSIVRSLVVKVVKDYGFIGKKNSAAADEGSTIIVGQN